MVIAAAAAIFTAADARAIRNNCHTPARWIAITRDGSFRFKPSRDADYRKVDCVLAELKQVAIKRGYRVGFIGNERAEPEDHPTPAN